MDVILGLRRHCERISEPIKPVLPVRMNFIVVGRKDLMRWGSWEEKVVIFRLRI